MVILGGWVFLMSEVPLYSPLEGGEEDSWDLGVQGCLAQKKRYMGASLIRNTPVHAGGVPGGVGSARGGARG